MTHIRYPEIPEIPAELQEDQRLKEYHETLREWWAAVVNELEIRDDTALFGPANADPYLLTGVSTVRVFNPTSATDTYTAQRLGTLLTDLKTKGVIS